MKQPTSERRETYRNRQTLGIAITAVAGLATIATSYGLDDREVKLPIQTVALSQANPVQTSRFRVETTFDMIYIEATLVMADAVAPGVTVSPIDGGSGTIVRSRIGTNEIDPQHVKLNVLFDLDCPNSVPCTIDFEALCTAQILNADVSTGTLAVKVHIGGNSPTDNDYLGIEPL